MAADFDSGCNECVEKIKIGIAMEHHTYRVNSALGGQFKNALIHGCVDSKIVGHDSWLPWAANSTHTLKSLGR